jgi:hypothetical protein
MHTLAQPADKAELLRRLKTLRSDSVRRWGRMSAHQMVCHLTDASRMMTGEKTVSAATGLLQRTLLKWAALYLPLPWPAGILTRPEIEQGLGGTCPTDFDADVKELIDVIHHVASGGQSSDWPPHPVFGPLSRDAWLRWTYLHMDHHLRQFGC